MNSDFKDLLRCLAEAGAKHLIVGGVAVIEYTEPRYTKDVDVWVGSDPDNAAKVFRALAAFGAPVAELEKTTFTEQNIFFQIGVAPVRIDLMTTVEGADFDSAWERREMRRVDELVAPFISKEDLISTKVAAGRKRDKLDLEALRRKPRGPKIPKAPDP
jgi:hypothetical protein